MEINSELQLINKLAILKTNLKAIDDKMIRIVDQRKNIYRKIKGLKKRISRIENDKTNQTL